MSKKERVKRWRERRSNIVRFYAYTNIWILLWTHKWTYAIHSIHPIEVDSFSASQLDCCTSFIELFPSTKKTYGIFGRHVQFSSNDHVCRLDWIGFCFSCHLIHSAKSTQGKKMKCVHLIFSVERGSKVGHFPAR